MRELTLNEMHAAAGGWDNTHDPMAPPGIESWKPYFLQSATGMFDGSGGEGDQEAISLDDVMFAFDNPGVAAAIWFMTDEDGDGDWKDDASEKSESLSVFLGAMGFGLTVSTGPAGPALGATLAAGSLGFAALAASLDG